MDTTSKEPTTLIKEPILTDRTVTTHTDWKLKEPTIRQDIIWGEGPTAIEDITKSQSNTDPDTIDK